MGKQHKNQIFSPARCLPSMDRVFSLDLILFILLHICSF
jgi:hypothetical protein